jgi:hypothetical protein
MDRHALNALAACRGRSTAGPGGFGSAGRLSELTPVHRHRRPAGEHHGDFERHRASDPFHCASFAASRQPKADGSPALRGDGMRSKVSLADSMASSSSISDSSN